VLHVEGRSLRLGQDRTLNPIDRLVLTPSLEMHPEHGLYLKTELDLGPLALVGHEPWELQRWLEEATGMKFEVRELVYNFASAGGP